MALNLTIPFRQCGWHLPVKSRPRYLSARFAAIPSALVVAAPAAVLLAPPVMRWYQMRRRGWDASDADDEAYVALAAAVLADVAAFVSDAFASAADVAAALRRCCRSG